MDINTTKCPNCAGTLITWADRRGKTCPYCDAVFELPGSVKDREVISENVREQPEIQAKNPSEIVRDICVSSGFDSIYGVVGHSLVNSSKYPNAKKNFGIASGEDVYLIFDATVFGSCKKGFAACASGFYYCANGLQSYYISWDKFKNVTIHGGKGSFAVGGAEFNTGSDGKKLYAILTDIKNNL